MSLSPEKPPRSGERKRSVLIVDDEPTLRLGFSYSLSSPSTSVETAATGRQALDKIKDKKFDIVILDLRMPDIDGIGVIEALRLSGNLVPIILCSAAITPTSALRAILNRVPDFLLKPVRPADLRDVVDYVLDPPPGAVSDGLVAARGGKLEAAIQLLRPGVTDDRSAGAWLDIFESLIDGADGACQATSERLLRSTLPILAFRAQPPATRA